MKRKKAKTITEQIQQNSPFLLFVLCFALVYFLGSADRVPKPTVIFVETNDEKQILEEIKSRGIIRGGMTYAALWLSSKFGAEFQPGGYAFGDNQTALAVFRELQDPTYKYIAIQEGLRKEEIADRYGKVLSWDENIISEFQKTFDACEYVGEEGKYFPGTYLISKDASIQDIKVEMENKFHENFQKIANNEQKEIYDEDQVLIIASLIQREAAGKSDMRLISGVIWNRIFAEMPLQIDATLQYVKGEDGKWWPPVKSEDKYLDSPFNTYQQKGLPPAPIANPGIAAIEAAINPLKTDCLFYLHDKRGVIHCSKNYEGHLWNIKNYL